MSVSVIIPFWNGSQWIERAVESVVGQTQRPAEFFVVNDGSKPEERALLGKLSQKYGFVILDKDNGGQGSARNFGVAHSTSEYICFLDQDDFFLPDHVELLYAVAQEQRSTNFGFAYGSFDTADGFGNILVKDYLDHNQAGLHPPSRDAIELAGRDIHVLPSASIISRSAFQSAGGFDIQFRGYEDDDLFSRLILAGFDYAYCPKSVYVWCQHKGSTTYSPVMRRSRFAYYRKIRAAHLRDARLMDRRLAEALAIRFGRTFYTLAADAMMERKNSGPDIEHFQAYTVDVVKDNLSLTTKAAFLFKARLVGSTDSSPLAFVWTFKRWNRRRVDTRRRRSERLIAE